MHILDQNLRVNTEANVHPHPPQVLADISLFSKQE